LSTSTSPHLGGERVSKATPVPGYRFCRTDDLPLLAAACNGCWTPHFPGHRALDPDDLKRQARELNLWASSCLVALDGDEPVGVLLGAKRDDANLVCRLAVKPGHERRGHGRHLLDSLRRKVHILGPPRLAAEIPAAWTAARTCFERCGFAPASRYADFTLEAPPRPAGAARALVCEVALQELLDGGVALAAGPPRAWARSLQTLKNREAEIAGLAVATDARVEAYVLARRRPAGADIVALGGGRSELLPLLVSALRERARGPLRVPKVGEAEIAFAELRALGFRATAEYVGYEAGFADL
jgi:GNAT superfamily N-acetyltransferase